MWLDGAVLGLRDGKKVAAAVLRRLPRREEEAAGVRQGRLARGAGGQARAQDGEADGERGQTARTRARARARARGRGQLPDSSDEDEEVGGACTPSSRAPASPCSGTSGSDEVSDKDDGSDRAARRRLSTIGTE